MTLILKCAALGALAVASLLMAWLLARAENVPGMQHAERYVQNIDARLRRLFLPARGKAISIAQVLSLVSATAIAVVIRVPYALLLAPCILFGPHFAILRLEKERRQKIEAKVDAFTVALANALRATPNIARALGTVAASSAFPLNQELSQTLRELRVGSTLEQALTDLSARVGSTTLDTTISALLIGRRVGGNIPEILSETGASLREMNRMHAVLRSKTADGRVQTGVLAVFPVGIVITFDLLSPGYFTPLTQTAVGSVIAIAAGVLWIAALALSHRIMKVQL
jgi:tight adherence protein B